MQESNPAVQVEAMKDALRGEIATAQGKVDHMKAEIARTLALIAEAEHYKGLVASPGWKLVVKDTERRLERMLMSADPKDATAESHLKLQAAQNQLWHLIKNSVIGKAGEGVQTVDQWREIVKSHRQEMKTLEAERDRAVEALAKVDDEAVN